MTFKLKLIKISIQIKDVDIELFEEEGEVSNKSTVISHVSYKQPEWEPIITC